MKTICLLGGLALGLLLVKGYPMLSNSDATDAGSLRDVILEQQQRHVPASHGLEAGECFTDLDLEHFKQEDVPGRIVRQLRASKRFRAVVAQAENMPETEWARYLQECRTLARPTFAQIGEVSARGQTAAGRQADLLISAGVVRLAEELATGSR